MFEVFFFWETHTYIYIGEGGWDNGIHSHANTKTACEYLYFILFEKHTHTHTHTYIYIGEDGWDKGIHSQVTTKIACGS